MFNVTCTLENSMKKIDPKRNYKPIVVKSVDSGENAGRDVIVMIGDELVRVNGYELKEAIKNCGANGMLERYRYRPRYKLEYVVDDEDDEDDKNEENSDDIPKRNFNMFNQDPAHNEF